MVWRRAPRTRRPAASTPEWRARFDEATRIILSQGQPAWVAERVAQFERALEDAAADDARLAGLIGQLDPERTAADLKRALRSRRPGDVDDPTTEALRRRYETANDLVNRRESLERQVRTAVSDLEVLAVQTVESRVIDSVDGTGVERQLARLNDDLRALELARAEIGRL